MTYDFFVFPATEADDIDEAVSVYESTAEVGPLTAGGPVAAFLDDVRGLPGVRAATGTDRGAHVATSWEDPMAQLRAVAGAARPRALSVLDPQLAMLYDPRHGADVALETQGGPRLPFTTRRTLREVLAQIRRGDYHWVSLSRDGGRFAQAYRDPDGSWAVEHRDALAAHFAARTADDEVVRELLWSWARGDDRWAAMLAFSPISV